MEREAFERYQTQQQQMRVEIEDEDLNDRTIKHLDTEDLFDTQEDEMKDKMENEAYPFKMSRTLLFDREPTRGR